MYAKLIEIIGDKSKGTHTHTYIQLKILIRQGYFVTECLIRFCLVKIPQPID